MINLIKRFTIQQGLAAAGVALMLGGSLTPAFAYNPRYNGYNRYDRNYTQSQYVKKALIGSAAGAVLGGVMGSEGYRGDSAIKGALLGAGAGLGYEYLRRNVLNNNSRW